MIVKGKYKYQYSGINLRASVAKRFRLFSKKIADSHSEALTIIMNFFEWHGFSPAERFENGVIKEIVKNRKRMDAS
ncbi:MAG: BfmA/BtgA family mobilization protein, partial [Allomuricauda sp.]